MRILGVIALAVILIVNSSLGAQSNAPRTNLPTAAAQPLRLNGTVMDPSGAIIPDAPLKLWQGTTVVREGKTDSAGNFTLDVPAGEYRLEVTAADFNLYRQNIRVVPNMARLTIRMVLATLNTNVDVSAGGDQPVSVDSDASLTTSSLTGDTIQALPDDEDQLLAQLQQIAGASGSTQNAAAVVVDGFTGGRVPPRDQIQQIIIDTNAFSAENNGGPRIQIITKPGTGPWGGSANLAIQNEVFNAKNPFDTNKAARRQHIFQWNYGGPVIPGKLTLRLNARSVQVENESASVLAVTPDGPINKGVFSPVINRFAGLVGQLYFTENNTLNFNGQYNTNAQKNLGIGGFTLPERAMNFKGHNWNVQLTERSIIIPKFISELRFFMFHNQNSLLPVSEGIAVNVIDAFSGGGAQNRTRRRGTFYNFGNTIRWTATPALNVQLGTEFTYNQNYSASETNYLGVFTFSSLDDYLAGRPITFRKTTGDPVVNVDQLEGAAFVQADWRLNSKLNAGAGVRYTAQTHLRDYNNVGPTFQIAYQPRMGTVLRAGSRLSYQVFNIENIETLKRQDGLSHQVETVITNPSYPDPFLNEVNAITDANNASIRVRDPNLAAPYTINSAFTLEQDLKRGWKVSTSFDFTRAVHLIRTRNINAPYPGTTLEATLFNRLNSLDPLTQATARDEVDRMRPFYPIVGNMYQFESAGSAFSKNLNVRVFLPPKIQRFKIGLTGFMQYTLGWTDDDASAVNQYDWRSEWTRASTDRRHRVQGNLNVTAPWSTSMSFLLIANSGRPYSITTGKDENGDQAANDRPFGIPRNSLRGPGSYNVDMLFTKQIPLMKSDPSRAANGNGAPGGAAGQVVATPQGPVLMPGPGIGGPSSGPRLSFIAQVRNLFNNTQLRGYSGVLTSPLFGKPTGTAPGRVMTLGLNFNW